MPRGVRGTGPPPKPTQMKIAENTVRNWKALEKAPYAQVLRSGSHAPHWLRTKHAIRAWHEFVGTLGDIEVATMADVQGLALLCDAFGRFLTAKDIVDEEGSTYVTVTTKGESIIREHPAYGQLERAWSQVHRMMIEFGLTPASRTRVTRVENSGEEDPFDAWEKGAAKKEMDA